MGSNGASIGNLCGKILFSFTAAGQDSGALTFKEVPPFYKARTFQLLIGGGGSGMTVQLYGTLDQLTCEGLATNWEPIPAPSTESTPAWSNPLTDSAGTRLFYCNAPLAAVRAVSSGAGWTGTATLLLLAAS